MAARNDNITKDPAAAGRKSKRGKAKMTLLKESLSLIDQSDVEAFQMGLKDNEVTSFRDLAKHSEEIKDLVWRIEQQFKQREGA